MAYYNLIHKSNRSLENIYSEQKIFELLLKEKYIASTFLL